MVGKYDPSVDAERRAGAHPPNRFPQRVDLYDQQVRPAVQQVRCEEECPTWNPIATVIRHNGSIPRLGERRKALRFSALRVLTTGAHRGEDDHRRAALDHRQPPHHPTGVIRDPLRVTPGLLMAVYVDRVLIDLNVSGTIQELSSN
jgi:hypothetical protein